MSLFKRRWTKERNPRTPLKWFVIISIVVVVVAVVLGTKGGVIDFIEHYFSYKDKSYVPLDIGHPPEEMTRKSAK